MYGTISHDSNQSAYLETYHLRESVGGGGEGTRKQVKVQCIKFGNKCHEGKKKNLGKREKE